MPDNSQPSANAETRVAFLILAHHEPKLLARLLRKLSAEWCHCFVHIDGKADIKQFEDQHSFPNVTFLSGRDRVSVHWCGYSVTTATLNLLRLAKASDFQPNRFVLLSGVDYPIKPLELIRATVGEDKEFIQIDRQIEPRGERSFDRCLNRRFLGDNSFLNPRTAAPAIDRLARRIERRLARSHPKGMTLFYGPQWWTLTNHGVAAIFAFLEQNPSAARWFHGAKVPDESMIHSILKGSSRAANIAFDATRPDEPPTGPNRHALHYIDWKIANPSLPKTLELSDLDALMQSGALFARKMDSARSAGLLDALDAVDTNAAHPADDNARTPGIL